MVTLTQQRQSSKAKPGVNSKLKKATRRPRRPRVRKFLHYVFDERLANRAVKFIERFCCLNKGFAGEPFVMLDFHRECTRELFGWIDPNTGLRRYRRAYVSTARKNAKSTWSAAIANYCLLGDDEPSPEVVCCANARHQAGIVFDAAADMIRPSPILSRMVDIIPSTKRILVKDGGGILKAVSADAGTEIGGNISCLIYDELSFSTNRELFDAVTSASGARKQPLKIFATTAGYDLDGVGHDLYKQAKAVEKNPKLDPTFFVRIMEVPKELDWTDESNWKLANPALGKFLEISELRENYKEAERSVSAQSKFRTLHLNQWWQSAESWLDVGRWIECADPKFDESQLKGQPCYLGVDLSSKTDLTALAALWPLNSEPGKRSFYLKLWFWIPDHDIRARVLRDHVPYDGWIEAGDVNATPGEVVDYSFVRRQIRELSKLSLIRAVGYDPWHATQFVQELELDGLECTPIRQGHESLGEPSTEFEALIKSQKIIHSGNPCMAWQVAHVITRKDANNNIVPDKKKSRHRIDGIVASIMALECSLRVPSYKRPLSADLMDVLLTPGHSG